MLAGALTKSVQPNASVAATGLSIRYIGEHLYGFSGVVSVDNNETVLMETTLGSGYTVATITFNGLSGVEDFDHFVYLNDEKVQFYRSEDRPGRAVNNLPILIPPFTKLKLTAQNADNTNARDQLVSITGRVYGAE